MDKIIKLSFLLLIIISVLPTETSFCSGIDVVSRGDNIMDITIDNMPLEEVLRELSSIVPFELKGKISSDEIVSTSFKKVSLEEVLKRILRGYNYVLIKSDEKKPLLMVMGKSERTKYQDTPVMITQKQDQMNAQQPSETQAPPAFVRTREGGTARSALKTGRESSNGEPQETKEEQPAQQESGIGVSLGSRSPKKQAIVMTQPKPLEKSLIPPTPPVIVGIDVPPSPPAVEAAPTAEAPPSIPSTIAETSSSGQGPSSPPAATQESAPAKGIEDLRPPQIPGF